MAHKGRVAFASASGILLAVLAGGLLLPRGLTGDDLGLRRFRTPELVDGDRVAQSFMMDADGLRAIGFHVAPTSERHSGTVVFELLRLGATKTLVRRGEAAMADVVRGDQYRFSFEPVEGSLHQQYSFEIAVSGTARAESMALWATKGEREPEGEFRFNGEPRWATLAFETDANVVSLPWQMLAASGWNPLGPRILRPFVVVALASVWVCVALLLRHFANAIQ
jgi:hypothetical protein